MATRLGNRGTQVLGTMVMAIDTHISFHYSETITNIIASTVLADSVLRAGDQLASVLAPCI